MESISNQNAIIAHDTKILVEIPILHLTQSQQQ